MQNASVLTTWAAGIHLCQNGMETTYISAPGMSVEASQEPTACRLQDKMDVQLLSDVYHWSNTLKNDITVIFVQYRLIQDSGVAQI